MCQSWWKFHNINVPRFYSPIKLPVFWAEHILWHLTSSVWLCGCTNSMFIVQHLIWGYMLMLRFSDLLKETPNWKEQFYLHVICKIGPEFDSNNVETLSTECEETEVLMLFYMSLCNPSRNTTLYYKRWVSGGDAASGSLSPLSQQDNLNCPAYSPESESELLFWSLWEIVKNKTKKPPSFKLNVNNMKQSIFNSCWCCLSCCESPPYCTCGHYSMIQDHGLSKLYGSGDMLPHMI